MTHTKSGVRTNGAHSLLKPCEEREGGGRKRKRERKGGREGQCDVGYHSATKMVFMYHNVFDVAEKVSKVDVEEITRCGHHDVIVVTITNTLQWCMVYNHMINHVT